MATDTPSAGDIAVEAMAHSSGYSHLSALDRMVAQTAVKPRWVIYFATACAVAVAWGWLVLIGANVATVSADQQLGPGMGLWQTWLADLQISTPNNEFLTFILQLCTPKTITSFSFSVVFSVFLMWSLMSVAMMLPSTAPMLRTYGDIADVAGQKGEKVVPLFVLALGYLAIWAVFAVLATAAQLLLIAMGHIANPLFPIQGVLGGALLILAGAYQFSALKYACLQKCRNPFSILFGRWTSEPLGVFKLGVEQGIYCIGCCWALMLVMLVVGTMNLAWMAFLTLFTIVEKSGKGKTIPYLSGGILFVWGGALMLLSVLSF